MAKFLDKKQQVLDIKLTPYGKHLLSVGTFKPAYYGFYDDNVLYDGAYAGLLEGQNDIIKRIKEDTQYLEGLVKFTDADDEVNTSTSGGDAVNVTNENGDTVTLRPETPYYEIDLTASLNEPTKTFLKYEIGDAYLDGNAQTAPAWKAVSLQGRISDSSQKDILNDIDIPQINVDIKYTLRIKEKEALLGDSFRSNIRDYITEIGQFGDNRVIVVEGDDLMMYCEEMNTVLLNENYDMEVYLVNTGSIPGTCKNAGTCPPTDEFVRKMFAQEKGYLQNGYYVPESSNPDEVDVFNILSGENTDRVKYYFDVRTDAHVDHKTACKALQTFDKSSYYIDLDFNCDDLENQDIKPFDIYGVVTEPELCQ
tara:strand:+ start:79 stop:1176 length:1098 start_codon:yes stop_codon:yes gene_type:complete